MKLSELLNLDFKHLKEELLSRNAIEKMTLRLFISLTFKKTFSTTDEIDSFQRAEF